MQKIPMKYIYIYIYIYFVNDILESKLNRNCNFTTI